MDLEAIAVTLVLVRRVNDTVNNKTYVEENLRSFHGFLTNRESFPY